MLGRTNTGGGGGGGLNFQVIGGTTAPRNPKENMIWVNTDVEITSWIFSAAEPESLAEGMVWISIGTSSTVEFNALKKNEITVYPISAKQYVNDAFEDKPAMIYQDGTWEDVYNYLYKPGMTDVLTPAAWKAVSGQLGVAPVVTYNDDSVEIKLTGGGGSTGVAYFDKKDLSEVRKVHVSLHIEPTFTADSLESGKSGNSFNIWKAVNAGYYETDAAVRYSLVPGQNDFDINVEGLDGEYYMGVGMRTAGSGYRTTTLYEVKLM